MQSYGFSNYNYWITPYGVHDDDMAALARRFGMKCLVSILDEEPNTISNIDKYWIKRTSLNPQDEGYAVTLQELLDKIDALKAGEWLIITTHMNDFDHSWLESSAQERFNLVVQATLNANCKILNFPEAFSYYEDIF